MPFAKNSSVVSFLFLNSISDRESNVGGRLGFAETCTPGEPSTNNTGIFSAPSTIWNNLA